MAFSAAATAQWAAVERTAANVAPEIYQLLYANEDVPWPLFNLYCDHTGGSGVEDITTGAVTAVAVEDIDGANTDTGTSMIEVVNMIDLADTLTDILLSQTTTQ